MPEGPVLFLLCPVLSRINQAWGALERRCCIWLPCVPGGSSFSLYLVVSRGIQGGEGGGGGGGLENGVAIFGCHGGLKGVLLFLGLAVSRGTEGGRGSMRTALLLV